MSSPTKNIKLSFIKAKDYYKTAPFKLTTMMSAVGMTGQITIWNPVLDGSSDILEAELKVSDKDASSTEPYNGASGPAFYIGMWGPKPWRNSRGEGTVISSAPIPLSKMISTLGDEVVAYIRKNDRKTADNQPDYKVSFARPNFQKGGPKKVYAQQPAARQTAGNQDIPY